MSGGFEILPHTADVGVRAWGDSLAEAVVEAAAGMFSIMYEVDCAGAETQVRAEAEAAEPEGLVVDLLAELLYAAEVGDLALCHFEATATDDVVEVVARGVPSATARVVGPQIKAVTYHDLRVRRDADGWEIHVIFDV